MMDELRSRRRKTIMIRVQSYSSAVVKSTTTDHRPCASLLVLIIIFFSSACSTGGPETGPAINETEKMKAVHALLKKINKPANKTIHSPDGDIIDCVDYHQQPAFDDPLLKAQKRPLSQAEWPEGHIKNSLDMENVQLWSLNGESCPEGTVPIRRTREQDILRAPSIAAFGKKMSTKRDSSNEVHEHAVGYVKGDSVYYGAKAGINVWAPHVADNSDEFSISQIWITSSSLDNTIEAGWQVSQAMYGDMSPRFFIYWTGDSYNNGCYNLGCSGFVQIGNKYAVGAAITPTSEYNGTQKDIEIYIWKDSNLGRWWLAIGAGEYVLGYWPSSLFPNLSKGASMLQFGGEVVNSKTNGQHTTTQMGSGHFARERFGKAAYFRNLQMVDSNNKIIPLSNLQVREDSLGCYTISLQPYQPVWGCYFYYGGPGKNPQSCP